MGNSETRNRRKNSLGVQKKRASISDIETARTGTQDFSTSHTLTGDIPFTEDFFEGEVQTPTEEEIIIKCSLEQVIKNFFKDYVIVWHDPNINSQENQQYIARLKKFCEVFTFTEWQKAKDFIQSSPTACHVVTSGTNGEVFVKEINQLSSVVNIYVFCGNKAYHSNWAKNYESKISCVETNIESVLSQIHSNLLAWYKQASSLKLNLPAFAAIFNDSDKSQMNNLHRFLKVIPNFKSRLQAKNDFINLSKAIYSDPLISEFEHNYNEYDKEQTLRWYTQESFLYKVTNNCLRIATSDSIQYCRLLLQDIEHAIKEQYHTKSKNFNGLLYRGAYLSQEEWSSLKANLNMEIEMHGFLSVSKVKNIGLNFMKADPSKKVFITIIVPQGPNEEEQGFAEIDAFSQFPQEKEILFNVRSRFTILETEDEESQGEPYRHLVLLYGAQGFRKYATEQNPLLEVSISNLKNVSCSQCKVTRGDRTFFISFREPRKPNYFCKDCVNSDHTPFLCIPPNKKGEESYKAKIQGFLLMTSEKAEIPFYGYKCFKCQAKKQKQYFTCTDCNKQWCQNCFSGSPNDCVQALHPLILETHHPFTFWSQKMPTNELTHLNFQNSLVANNTQQFQQAEMYLESLLYEQAIEYYNIYIQRNEGKGEDSNLARAYQSLGATYNHQGQYKKAQEYYFKFLEMETSIHGDNHPQVATAYLHLASVFDEQGEYTKALEYYFESLNIFESDDASNHLDLATCYRGIGLVYSQQKEYTKALEFFFKSLDIGKSILGDDDPGIANVYNNIAMVFEKQKEYARALEYHLKSLDINKTVYGENHPDIAASYNNIGGIYDSQGEHTKALECYLKSLEITKLIRGENHPKTAASYNNIGFLSYHQGEYNKALEYYFKSLKIQKTYYGDSHPEIATSYQNIGLAYNQQREYKKALEYYLKALDIQKLVHGGDKDLDIAGLYQNLGKVSNDQGEYKKALEYYFKSLDIIKSVHGGDNHIDVAALYQNIGRVFNDQGEYAKAFEYFLKCLEIQKSVCEDNHLGVATSYNNLGFVCHQQGECKKALEYFFKSLDICKSYYGDHHRELAFCYCNIYMVYNQQGESQKALEYYLKYLESQKLVYGNSHPEILLSYNELGSLYYDQGEWEKALECYFKSLDISKSIYGDNHLETAPLYENIGRVFLRQGDYAKAIGYCYGALNIIESIYGKDHFKTIDAEKRILGILINTQQK